MASVKIRGLLLRFFTSSRISQSYPAVFALLHPQSPLQVQLSDLLRRRSPHGSHQVEVVVLLKDLRGSKRDKEHEISQSLRRAGAS